MNHQDWKPVIFGNKPTSKPKTNTTSHEKEKETKLNVPSKLGQLICQARTSKNKNQKQFAQDVGITQSLLARWEKEIEIPTNADIAKMEKILGIKLPRVKKTTI